MRKVLKDEQLEKEFQEQGFVSVPFITKKELSFLSKEFDRLIVSSEGMIGPEDTEIKVDEVCDIDFTFLDKNIEHKKEVFDSVVDVFEPFYKDILADYKPIIANFIRKKAVVGKETLLHQNWAFIDEKKGTSVSIWCPLIDSTRKNGALEVVPRSHKRFGEVRGPMIPWELEGIKNEIIENDLVCCETKAGDAVIIDDSIIHYTYPNTTEELRLAIQLILVPKEQDCIHYHMNPEKGDSEVHTLKVDKDFFMAFNPWKKPTGVETIGNFKLTSKNLTRNEYLKRFKNPKFDEKLNLFQKVKAIFN